MCNYNVCDLKLLYSTVEVIVLLSSSVIECWNMCFGFFSVWFEEFVASMKKKNPKTALWNKRKQDNWMLTYRNI